jgi:hypothetical protein
MTNPMLRIHDIATDEIIDREMTDAELLELENSKEAEATKAAEKAALLTKLGITADEAKLLLS